MQQPPYAMTPPPPPPPKKGMPAWGWVLLGCSGMGCLVVPVLAAIVFPVFAQAREKARQTACLSNTKQIALSLTMYAADNDDLLPPSSKWMDATEPYVKGQNVYHCPSAWRAGDNGPSYAFDDGESGKNTHKMPDVARHLVVYESKAHVRNAHDAFTSVVRPGRHRGGNNYAAADGHATWIADSAFTQTP